MRGFQVLFPFMPLPHLHPSLFLAEGDNFTHEHLKLIHTQVYYILHIHCFIMLRSFENHQAGNIKKTILYSPFFVLFIQHSMESVMDVSANKNASCDVSYSSYSAKHPFQCYFHTYLMYNYISIFMYLISRYCPY